MLVVTFNGLVFRLQLSIIKVMPHRRADLTRSGTETLCQSASTLLQLTIKLTVTGTAWGTVCWVFVFVAERASNHLKHAFLTKQRVCVGNPKTSAQGNWSGWTYRVFCFVLFFNEANFTPLYPLPPKQEIGYLLKDYDTSWNLYTSHGMWGMWVGKRICPLERVLLTESLESLFRGHWEGEWDRASDPETGRGVELVS